MTTPSPTDKSHDEPSRHFSAPYDKSSWVQSEPLRHPLPGFWPDQSDKPCLCQVNPALPTATYRPLYEPLRRTLPRPGGEPSQLQPMPFRQPSPRRLPHTKPFPPTQAPSCPRRPATPTPRGKPNPRDSRRGKSVDYPSPGDPRPWRPTLTHLPKPPGRTQTLPTCPGRQTAYFDKPRPCCSTTPVTPSPSTSPKLLRPLHCDRPCHPKPARRADTLPAIPTPVRHTESTCLPMPCRLRHSRSRLLTSG